MVARLDADDLRAQLRAAEAQVVQAREAVEESQAGCKSRTDVSLAGKTLKRSESLVDKGFISRSKLDTDQTGMEGAMAGMDQARAGWPRRRRLWLPPWRRWIVCRQR